MFARTKRLTLRPGWPEDAATLAAAIDHDIVTMRLSRVPWPYTPADAADWLARPRGADDVFFLVFDHPDMAEPRLVGSVGLHPEDGELELGYWYTPAAWGNGYATEAGRAVVDVARHALGRARLASRYHIDNTASGRVLGKLGFVPTGETRQVHSQAQGCEVATAMMRLDLATTSSGV